MIILIPFEIKLYAVPHLKGLINGVCKGWLSLYKDHALGENMILVHKTQIAPIFILSSVSIFPKFHKDWAKIMDFLLMANF